MQVSKTTEGSEQMEVLSRTTQMRLSKKITKADLCKDLWEEETQVRQLPKLPEKKQNKLQQATRTSRHSVEKDNHLVLTFKSQTLLLKWKLPSKLPFVHLVLVAPAQMPLHQQTWSLKTVMLHGAVILQL